MTRTRSGHNYTAKKVKRTRKPKGVMSAEQTPQGADPNLLLLMQEMLRDRQQREAQIEEVPYPLDKTPRLLKVSAR